ncbi:MAG: AP2 domain-containing protein, partial [Desulfobacteraceae bacterium]|nr:AP2 domain-containing protein [Desulfobacteraceae bacterium]
DRHVCTMSNNSTGVVGVRFKESLQCYEVSWAKPDGHRGRTSVSTIKHGKQGAFKLACTIRNQKETERLEAD